MLNNSAWLNGAYVYHAVSVAINNAFNKSKLDYLSKPFETKKTKEEIIENEVISIQNRVAEVQALFKNKDKKN